MKRTRSRRSHGFLQAFRQWAPWIAHLALAAILNTALDGPVWADEIGRHRTREASLVNAERLPAPPSVDELVALLTPALERALAPYLSAQQPLPPPPSLPDFPREESDAPAPSASVAEAAAATGDAVPLIPGWNLISLPKQPDSVDPAAVFSSIAGSFSIVHAYNACDAADPWRTYNPAAAPGDNDLTAVDHRPGLWVRATAVATLAVSGTEPAETSIQLCQGWNLIGYPLAQPRPVLAALSSIAGKFLRVYGWDPADPVDPWEVFDVAVPAWANDLELMQPGRGYWLYATEDTTLVMSNEGLPPEVDITAPANAAAVTAPTDIVGTVKSDLLERWTLAYRLKGETGAFTTFASGNTPVANGVLGKLDPTLLLNGLYEIELTAEDFQGQSTSTSIDVVVEGDLKIGNFTLTFIDLEIPMAGLPIQVIRTYDSRDKRVGDFGVGWTLSLTNVRLQEDGPVGDNWQGTRSPGAFPNYCVFPTDEHQVTITLPDDTVLRFRPKLTPECQLLSPPQVVTLSYVPLTGTRGSLEMLDQNPQALVVGSFPGHVQLWDQDSVELGDPNRYRLTLKDGRQLVVDQSGGLVSLRDLNDNELSFGTTGIRHSSGKDITFQRDTQGRITRIVDLLGNSMEYRYDADGNLQSWAAQDGQVSRYTYNGRHDLIGIEDPRGIQPLRNEYDANGRLIRHTDASGAVIEYTHSFGTRQELIRDRLGNLSVLGYDDSGNLVSQTDPLGNTATFTYDAQGNRLSETSPSGHTTTFAHDARGNVLQVVDPANGTTSYSYNDRDQVLTVTDALGKTTSYSYDSRGNLLTAVDPAGNTTSFAVDAKGNLLSVSDALGKQTQLAYDSFGNLLRTTDPAGFETSYTYDANGNRLTESSTRTDSQGNQVTLTTRRTYDQRNRVTAIVDAEGSQASFSYDPAGRLIAATDALENRTEYAYDQLGNLVRRTYADGTEERFSYDAEGRNTAAIDRLTRTTLYGYDKAGRLIRTTAPDGTSVQTEYDPDGRIIRRTDERGISRQNAYDAAGRLASTTDPLGHVTRFEYHPNGVLSRLVNARGHATEYFYDENNRRTLTRFPDGTSISRVYDALGRKIAASDQAGQTTHYEYDALGRLTKVTDALGGITGLAYDEVGNLIRQTDANGRITSFSYDNLGRPVAVALPSGARATTSYDAAGNISAETDFNGNTINYEYDSVYRSTKKTLPDNSAVTYAYKANGLLERVTDARGATTYEYDSRDRLTLSREPDGRTVSYTYDAAGNRLSVAFPTGTTTYTYDALNRLETVADPQGRITRYGYDPLGNRSQIVYPNGIVTSYEYDSLNRLTSIENRKGSDEIISSYDYALGPAGNRLQVVEATGRRVDYRYDALYRLIEEQISDPVAGARALTYTYDAVGNRLTRSDNGTATTYTYDENHRLRRANDDVFSYDANGSLLTRTGPAGTISYSFDSENRLRSAVLEGPGPRTQVDYVYDADGNRVQRTVNGSSVTRFLIDRQQALAQVLLETDQNGDPLASYVHGDDLISQSRGGSSFFYLHDGQMSVRQLTDTTGAVTDDYVYDAFGNLLRRAGATQNHHLYTGEALEPETGLYYLRARYMDPSVGRFATADEVAGSAFDPPTLHKYAYAGNDPVNQLDPSGRSFGDVMISVAIQGIVQAIAFGIVGYSFARLRGLPHEVAWKQAKASGGIGFLLAIPYVGIAVSLFLLGGFLWAAYNGELEALDYWELATYLVVSLVLRATVTPALRPVINRVKPPTAPPPTPEPPARVFRALENGVVFPEGVQGTSPNAGNFSGLRGADPMTVLERVPANWIAEPADTGTGVVFRNPANLSYDWIRIMNGEPSAKFLHSRGPYLRVFRNGAYLDDAGVPQPNSRTGPGHIPLKGNPAL